MRLHSSDSESCPMVDLVLDLTARQSLSLSPIWEVEILVDVRKIGC
jgi:hypothetical protein